ncbi:MAG TPA: DUF1559 domain-containing protein [Lacipirellulaceae bacterium]|nr:DUF1559 domain-containing protein [Lacipirellulaceae bacterium]
MNGGNSHLGISSGDGAPVGCDDLRNPLWTLPPPAGCSGWAHLADTRLIGVPPSPGLTGIVAIRSKTTLREISDGTSNTILAGEKFLRPQHYESGVGLAADGKGNPGDNSAMYQGYDYDNVRLPGTNNLPLPDASPEAGDVQEQRCFGSPHAGGISVVMVDGSVQNISYDIDGQVWSSMGHRSDGG